MIVVCATGHVLKKPELRLGPQGSQRTEFTVGWRRRARVRGTDGYVLETVTFAAVGQQAEHVALSLEHGSIVTASGTQETYQGREPSAGPPRVLYQLQSFAVVESAHVVGDDDADAVTRRGLRPTSQAGLPTGGPHQQTRQDDDGLIYHR